MLGPRGRFTTTRRAGAAAGIAALALAAAVAGAVPAVAPVPAQAASTPPPDVAGQWTEPFAEGGAATAQCQPAGDRTGPAACRPTAVEAAVLKDGRILYLNGVESQSPAAAVTTAVASPPAGNGQVRILDLRSGTPEWTTPKQPGGLFCSDITELPDGRLLLAGGPDWFPALAATDRSRGGDAPGGANLFDPKTRSFQPAAPMKHGRWYPHVAIGPDGQATVFGGVARLTGDTQPGSVRRTETYHADTDTWEENYTGPASENGLPVQPRIVLAPNGRFFYAAVGELGGPSAPAADEATAALYQFFDPRTKKWEVSGVAPFGARSGAFVVPLTMEPPYDQMTLVTGGGVVGPIPGLPAIPVTALTTIDGNGDVAGRQTGNLNHARWFSSGVLLPDGRLLAVGGDDRDDTLAPGTGGTVRIPELYDPATGKWADVAPQRRDRGYHSSALLLPDMRVLLGGGTGDPSFEIWSPPYLFRGARPVVQRVQRAVSYGESFDITTPDADLIESVLLLRTPSPEHGNDSDQRALKLEFSRSDEDTVTATAPPSGKAAPPGTYYLVVNKKSLQGPIPSVARMVDVGRTDLTDALQPFPDDAPTPVDGSVR
jgi:galactose oxidase